jgi:hypothetical protein
MIIAHATSLVFVEVTVCCNCCGGETHVPDFGDDDEDETLHDSLGKNRKSYQHNTLQAMI